MALRATGVSQSELARRLATTTATADSKRRWILKVLADDEIDTPEMGPVAEALNLPADYFVLPTREQVERRRVRLEELETRLAEVARVQALLLDELALAVDEQGRLASRPSQGQDPRDSEG